MWSVGREQWLDLFYAVRLKNVLRENPSANSLKSGRRCAAQFMVGEVHSRSVFFMKM